MPPCWLSMSAASGCMWRCVWEWAETWDCDKNARISTGIRKKERNTPTKRPVIGRPVTKCPVTKRPFTRRPVTKRPDYKTSWLPNVLITKRPDYQTSSYRTSSYKTSTLVIITKHPVFSFFPILTTMMGFHPLKKYVLYLTPSLRTEHAYQR